MTFLYSRTAAKVEMVISGCLQLNVGWFKLFQALCWSRVIYTNSEMVLNDHLPVAWVFSSMKHWYMSNEVSIPDVFCSISWTLNLYEVFAWTVKLPQVNDFHSIEWESISSGSFKVKRKKGHDTGSICVVSYAVHERVCMWHVIYDILQLSDCEFVLTGDILCKILVLVTFGWSGICILNTGLLSQKAWEVALLQTETFLYQMEDLFWCETVAL